MGENGSGKSTLLQMVAGILRPTSGTVAVNGRVSALLELGAGFNPEFSGRDNVYLNGSILGLTTRQIDQRYEDIEAFAEIGDFINQPVKTYSSGMVVRLAFAVAINVDPEILLVDEALAVGDIYFRQRCMRKVHELRARGITILFVSHAVADVKAIGDRALWLDRGRLVEIGEPDRVVAKYLAAMVEKDSTYLHAQGADRRAAPGAARSARRRSSRPSPTSTTATATAAPRSWASPLWTSRAEPLQHAGACVAHRGAHQRARQRGCAHADRRLHAAQSVGHGFLRHQHRARRLSTGGRCSAGDVDHGGFPSGPAGTLSGVVFFFAGHRRRHADGLRDVRLDRQRPGAADGRAPKARSTGTCTCPAAWK